MPNTLKDFRNLAKHLQLVLTELPALNRPIDVEKITTAVSILDGAGICAGTALKANLFRAYMADLVRFGKMDVVASELHLENGYCFRTKLCEMSLVTRDAAFCYLQPGLSSALRSASHPTCRHMPPDRCHQGPLLLVHPCVLRASCLPNASRLHVCILSMYHCWLRSAFRRIIAICQELHPPNTLWLQLLTGQQSAPISGN